MLTALKCRWMGHRINRHRVKYDGLDFRTRCDRCGTALVRQKQGWREAEDGPVLAADRS